MATKARTFEEKVEFILRAKFPGSWAPAPLPPLRASPALVERTRDHRARHEALMQEVAAERLRLKFMPDVDFEKLYQQVNATAVDAIRQRERDEEAARFFNLPSAAADFSHWAKADFWSKDEATALLLGKSPEVVTWAKVQPHLGVSPFANEFRKMRDIARRSRSSLGDDDAVEPSRVIGWADESDYSVPPELRQALLRRKAKARAAAVSTTTGSAMGASEEPAMESAAHPAEAQASTAVSIDRLERGSGHGFDYAMHATRDGLIDAFGPFTGMNKDWFKNLKDTPALARARKSPGQGGRGHIKEPYFCPIEVMQWLIDPRRKKGRRLSEEKGWEMLEKHFPKVYAKHSAADPRE